MALVWRLRIQWWLGTLSEADRAVVKAVGEIPDVNQVLKSVVISGQLSQIVRCF